jgi:alkyldihydroxyacetonephosphate synthase
MKKRLKYWGWGNEGDCLDAREAKALLTTFADGYGIRSTDDGSFPALDAIALAAPRLVAPASLVKICTSDRYERVLHAFGQSQPDSIRIYMGEFAHAPDVVAYPESESDISKLYDWCGDAGAALIPYGGGSSVVGGVTGDVGGGFNGTVTVDMSRMNKVLEVDDVSRAARIQGGARGPELEAQLKRSGLTLRHFPQSFEHSTLGGWVATRSGGHFATLYTHIDDLVESVTMVTPAGKIVSRRLPCSGAGPSPDRFMIGSEGALGIITEAWMRLQGRPGFKATEPGPLHDRFGRCARHNHRGLDAAAGEAGLQGDGRLPLRRFLGRRACRARGLAGRPFPCKLAHRRWRRIEDQRRGRRLVHADGGVVREFGPPGRCLDGACRAMLPRSRRYSRYRLARQRRS